MPNLAPKRTCPRCGCVLFSNLLPRHLPVCLGKGTLWDLYRIGAVIRDPSGCHLWDKKVNQHGYGLLPDLAAKRVGERRAHRAAWVIKTKKPVPAGLNVLHHCDVPACLNPKHLYLGDQKDNARDMTARGRHGGRFVKKPRVQRSCVVCGTKFAVLESDPRQTCTRSCAAKKSWATKPVRAIKRAEPQERVCPWCSTVFVVDKPSSRKKTCASPECRGKQIWASRR